MALFYVVVTKTNSLSQTEMGTLSILSFLASTFSLFTLLALPTALTKFTSEKLEKNTNEATAIQKKVTKIVIALSIIGLTIAILLSQFITQYLWNSTDLMLLIILNFVYAFLINMRNIFTSTLQAIYLFGKIAIITIIFVITSRIIAIVLVLLNIGIMGVIIGYTIGSLITVIVAINFLRNKLPKTTTSIPLKPILYFSFPLFLTSITSLVLNWADIVIITSLTSNYSLTGVYFMVVNSVGALSILYLPIMTTILPTISAYFGRKKLVNIDKILKTTSRIIIYIMLPSCIGLAIIAPTALTLFYGSSYAGGATPLVILSISTIITALYLLFTTTLTAIGKTTQILRINVVSAGILIITLLILVPILETTGAAFARLTTQIMSLALAIYILRNQINIKLDKEAIWKSGVSTIAFVPILVIIELVLIPKLSTIQTFSLELLTAIVVYAFSLYLLKALKSQDFQLLKQALPKPLTKYLNIIENIMVR